MSPEFLIECIREAALEVGNMTAGQALDYLARKIELKIKKAEREAFPYLHETRKD